MSVDLDTFKQVLGSWPSGVTIVTARAGDLQHGMTASAFCSVSAEPPQAGGVYTVNTPAQGQDELSNLFADKSREAIRFDGLDCELGATGCPRIPGALAHLDCKVTQAIEAGTHVIYVGHVEGAAIHDAAPLAFFRGRYHSLS
jgi:flavin reductase (DIM6/NTAB) family NADH-FMN oxidoreductase RutF